MDKEKIKNAVESIRNILENDPEISEHLDVILVECDIPVETVEAH